MSDPSQTGSGPLDATSVRATSPGRTLTDSGGLRPQGPFPQSFGRYLVLRKLGGGAMATVYLADDTRLETQVALKVPHPHLLEDATSLDRFYREARIAARLKHPNLCQVFDVGEHEGTHYIAFRYVEGRPLSHAPPGSPRASAELVRKIAAALAEAHRLGVIHRDLKPANVLITPEGDPVVTDFGMALRLGGADPRLTQSGSVVGTPLYMAPEQFRGDPDALGPACDVYSLGVILYELLTGKLPFEAAGLWALRDQVLQGTLLPPSAHAQDLDSRLEAVCLKALARRPAERFANMDEFAEALAEFTSGGTESRLRLSATARPQATTLVDPSAVRFTFLGPGERVPTSAAGQDRLFLELGLDLRPGVIDHHHLTASSVSTSSLVLTHPDLILGALSANRSPTDRFTIVLQSAPDLDAVSASWLALAYLTGRSFPKGADALARYLDKVDEGSLGVSPSQPFPLYPAYRQLAGRLARRPWNSDHERWQEAVRRGLELVAFVVREVAEKGTPLPAVDAFACPGLFSADDRQEVLDDAARYARLLADPASKARRVSLRLPGQLGGVVEAETLLIRPRRSASVADRVMFFRDWARADATNCPDGRGFVGLCVFLEEEGRQKRRAVISVTPASGASLRGLAALLDRAEAERRTDIYGSDDRVTDPATGAARAPRAGYANADPWYDGRAHGYTLVDAPRSGTLLTAEEIETALLEFGGNAAPVPLNPGSA